jgi:hypothetical protein
MWQLGPLTFVAPWALVAGLLLPLVWWLLRVIPPAPRRLSFPAVSLLFGLRTASRTSARTPLWLVLLRLLLAALAIVGAAHPLLNAAVPVTGGPLLIVIDDGWAAANEWTERRTRLDVLLEQAERAGRPVLLLRTAPPAGGGPVTVSALLPAAQAKAVAQAIQPQPWPTDRRAALRALDRLPPLHPIQVEWLSDGLDDPDAAAFVDRLRHLGGVEVVVPAVGATGKLLVPPAVEGGELAPMIRRAAAGRQETLSVRAVDGQGRTVARTTVTLSAGETRATAPLRMPNELRNRVARLDIEGESTAAATVLLDDRWKRHPVGLIDEQGRGSSVSPLLDDLFYTERAISPVAEVHRGVVGDLLHRELSLAVLPDQGGLADDDLQALRTWVEQGGMLVRLAGPKLARNPDDLLPVRLRGGGRTLGGAMSWTQPMAVAAMPDAGPFAGLPVPPDLRVNAQVLAEPSVDLNDKTWARLEDGTPLVTGQAMGKGWLVLIHTSVGPAWSNLGLSGLFPEMMQRLLARSRGVAGSAAERPLAPADLLDGFGRLVGPTGVVEAIPPHSEHIPIGPKHPPGFYGDEAGQRALNLASAVDVLRPLALPPEVRQVSLVGQPTERDLQPLLLIACLAVLLVDMLVILGLRGQLGRWRAAALAIGIVLFSGSPHAGQAAEDKTLEAALSTRLAYVETGDAQEDDTARAGLIGLTRVLDQRTTASLGPPAGVDVERDALMVYPLLYWPVTGQQPGLSATARDKVNDFMRRGGMILFDILDRPSGGSAAFRSLAQGMDIPPLATLTEDHVLTRSFYLLREWPGRVDGGPVYVQETGDPANDNVSPVVIGGGDWAAAWAVDSRGNPLHAVIPGGEEQREMAFRFGVNLVMYALTGSYKADQVHLPAILERLRQ